MLEGALILLAGLVIGRFAPARRRRPKPPKPRPEPEPICGCAHGFHDHDPATGKCHGMRKAYEYNISLRREILDKYVPCTCRQYTGPTPLPDIYAPEIAGPR